MPRGRLYDLGSQYREALSSVVELHLDNNASAQVSALPDGDGFLIRVWPQDGTHEYGGSNLTALSTVIRFTDDGVELQSLHVDNYED